MSEKKTLISNQNRRIRKTFRLKNFDYSSKGAYFVTICTINSIPIFGEIINGIIVLNESGKIANEEWFNTGIKRENIQLDEFIVMPNHIHGIIFIVSDTARCVPTSGKREFGKMTKNSLSSVVRAFKSATTRRINISRNSTGEKIWQGRFYEHIILNEDELNKIREYINLNPRKWEFEKEQPENIEL